MAIYQRECWVEINLQAFSTFAGQHGNSSFTRLGLHRTARKIRNTSSENRSSGLPTAAQKFYRDECRMDPIFYFASSHLLSPSPSPIDWANSLTCTGACSCIDVCSNMQILQIFSQLGIRGIDSKIASCQVLIN